MAKTKISEFSSTPGNNTDIDSINIAEGCAPSGINNAIRELMAQLKDFQAGTAGDSFNGPVGTSTAAAGAFTTLTASSTATLNTLASSGATLTGGTINNMAIGGTTAAAVSATTLTTSSTVTHNGGTANGVAYLNGSKVLTTGSALTFDGTRLTVKGGNANSLWVDNGGQRYTELDIANNGTIKSSIYWDNTSADLFYSSTGSATFGAASYYAWNISSEQMRLTSTGLGIGTSSPSTKLHVAGVVVSGQGVMKIQDLGGSGTSAFPVISLYDAGGTNQGNLGMFAGDQVVENKTASGKILFKTNSSTVATLDTSGNLGLGVTPSAWMSGVYTVMDVGAASSFGGFAAGASGDELSFMATNTFFNSSNNPIYKASGLASNYRQFNGVHQWFTAPSGTAGNAISFTQAMTLDASGNLAIGHTSPSTRLDVVGSSQIRHQFTGAATGFSIGQYNSSGDASINNGANAPLLFATNNTERARIDSSGRLIIGGTAVIGPGKINTYFDGSIEDGIDFRNTNTGNTGVFAAFFNSAGGVAGTISQSSATTVLYNTSSDYRLKTVIGAVIGAGERIDALQPVEYTWNSDGSRTRGFLAHQFQEVYAGSVTGSKDAVDAEGKPVYQAMQASSSEVIADLVAEIQSLRQRLAAAGI